MALGVGLTTKQGVSNGSTPLATSDKHNVGMLFQRERGVPNKPIPVTTIQEDRRRFGGIVSGQYGALVTRALFKNAGQYGATIYGVRIVGSGSTAATVNATDVNADTQTIVNTLVIAASSTDKEKRTIAPRNVGKGDIFQLIIAQTGTTGSPYTFSVTATEASARNVVTLWLNAMRADTNFPNNFTLNDKGDYFELESVAVNKAITITPSTTNGSTTPVTICNVWAAQEGVNDPGTWANNRLQIKMHPYGSVLNGMYLLEVYYDSVLVESWSNSSIAAMYSQINSNSQYVRLVEVTAGAWVTTTQMFTLSGGTYTAPSAESEYYPTYDGSGNPKGMAIFDGVDVQLICCADYHTSTMALQGRDYCAARDAKFSSMYVTALPQFANDSTITSFASALQTADLQGSYVASYNIWANVSDEKGSNVWIPAIGHVIGAGYIRNVMMNKDYIWTAPAGYDTAFTDYVEIAPTQLSDSKVNTYVQTYSINVARFQRGAGYFIYTSRTMSSNQLFHSVHIRRMTNWLLATIQTNYGWILQKNNSPELRRQIVVSLTQFFKSIYSDGGLERSVDFDTACKVICDSTNNPSTQSRKDLNVDVDWIPVECIEGVRISLNRNDGILISAATTE